MPTAQKFASRGMGNGFPYCPPNVDVSKLPSDFAWTTFSGVNADNYTSFSDADLKQKINESFVIAMKLYWNKFRSTGFQSQSSGSASEYTSRFQPTGGLSVTWSQSMSGMTSDDAIDAGTLEPMERVCGSGQPEVRPTEDIYGTDQDGSQIDIGNSILLNRLSTIFLIYDEDKFLGYSFSLNSEYVMSASSSVATLDAAGSCQIVSASGMPLLPDVNETFEKRNTSYVTIDGIHFVSRVSGSIDELPDPSAGHGYSGYRNNPSITLTSGGATISYSYGWTYTASDDPVCGGASPGRFCFDKFKDIDFSCSVTQATQNIFYTY